MSLLSFIPLIGEILDRVIPDPKAATDAKVKLMQMAQDGQLAELNALKDVSLAQAATNTAEASSDSKFVGGWRPSIGYVCAFALFYNYIVYPMLIWATAIWWPAVHVPASPVDENMWELIMGMLGLSFARSFDKYKSTK